MPSRRFAPSGYRWDWSSLAYAAASFVNKPLRDDIRQGTPNLLGFGLHMREPVTADE